MARVLRTKTFVSTNVELLDKKVNDYIEKLYCRNCEDVSVEPVLSVASVGSLHGPRSALSPAYFIGCQITYYDNVEVEQQMDMF